MSYMVTAYETKIVNLAPETVTEEVLQNVATIISTPKFTVPLDRKLGLMSSVIDRPIPIAKALIIGEIMDAIEEYEPRAEIVEITFLDDGETEETAAGREMRGKIVPRVEVNIIGEE